MMPPRAILAAVDFSDASRVALGVAARLARHCGATLHLLHVQDPLLSAAAARAGVSLATESREELDRLAGELPADEAHPVRTHILSGQAVDAIIALAARENIDLVTVASHGMSGPARAVFGSVTEGVLRRADRPVLVVPGSWSATDAAHAQEATGALRIGPLVVGIDFSAASVAAATEAAALAAALGTSLEAMHVVPDLPVIQRWQPHADAAVADRVLLARRDLARLLESVQAPVATDARVETGSIAERLAEAVAPIAGRRPLLVLGRHAPGHGARPGSIACRVLALAQVPVLMVVGPASA